MYKNDKGHEVGLSEMVAKIVSWYEMEKGSDLSVIGLFDKQQVDNLTITDVEELLEKEWALEEISVFTKNYKEVVILHHEGYYWKNF